MPNKLAFAPSVFGDTAELLPGLPPNPPAKFPMPGIKPNLASNPFDSRDGNPFWLNTTRALNPNNQTNTSISINVAAAGAGVVNFLHVGGYQSSTTGTDPGIATPAGWTLMGYTFDDNVTTSPIATAVFCRVWQTGDSSSVTITQSIAGQMCAVMVGYIDVNLTTPYANVAVGPQVASSASKTTLTVTTTVPGVVASGFIDRTGTSDYSAYTDNRRDQIHNSSAINMFVQDSLRMVAAGSQTRTATGPNTAFGGNWIYLIQPLNGPVQQEAQVAMTSAHTLTSAGTYQAEGIVSMSSTHTLTSAAFLEQFAAVALVGTHTLTAAATVQKEGTATLTQTHTLTTAATLQKEGAAALSGTHTLTAAAIVTENAAAALTSTHTLTSAGLVTENGAAALTGTHTLTAAGIVTELGAAALSAIHTLTTAATLQKEGAAALTQTHTLTSDATVIGGTAQATLTSAHTFTNLLAAIVYLGNVAFSQTHTLTAAALVTDVGTATLQGTHTLTAAAKQTFFSNSALTQTHTLTADAVVTKLAQVAMAATHTLTPAGTRDQPAVAALTGTHTLTSAGTRAAQATASLSAAHVLTAAATLVRFGASPLASVHTLTTTGAVALGGHVAMTSQHVLFGKAKKVPGPVYAHVVENPRISLGGSTASKQTFTVKQNDLLPPVIIQLLDGSTPVDLTANIEVRLIMYSRKTGVKVTAPMVVIDLAQEDLPGAVLYAWEVGDLDTVGTYSAEIEVVWPGNLGQTFPAIGSLQFKVVKDLAQSPQANGTGLNGVPVFGPNEAPTGPRYIWVHTLTNVEYLY